MIYIIILAVGILGVLLLGGKAFSGPNPRKAQKRRMELIKERHADGILAANAQAQIRKLMQARASRVEGIFSTLIPKPALMRQRLERTGKPITLGKYSMSSLGLAAFVASLAMLKGAPFMLAFFVGLFAGVAVPHFVVGYLIKRRLNQFNSNFPDAIELMVRGLRSGLPISETIGVVANEIQEPVKTEFRAVSDKMRIGRTMEAALTETAERLNTPEFQFFVISLAIQRETGGNLAETLSNLTEVLRKRAAMKLKIRAMSSESKASAYIIGALPFIVFGLICYINYEYMSPFFTGDPTGLFGLGLMQIVGIGGLGWMSIGAFIMAQMINFEI